MAKVYASLASTTVDPTQYSVGQGQFYTRRVYDFLNMTNGNTLFYKCRVFKDANLLKNPLKRRYEEYDNAQSLEGAPYIGERYNVYNKLGRQIVFLDDVGGLSGYTHEEGYDDLPLSQSTRTNIENMHKKSWEYSVIPEGVDLSYDIFNRIGSKVLPFERYLLDENLGNGLSIESIIDTSRFGKSRYTLSSNENGGKMLSTTYLLYDERTDGDSHSFERYRGNGPHDNQSEGNLVDLMDEYDSPYASGSTSILKSTLLGKTNDLFRRGKIGSLINRFHTKAQDTNELETAVDSEYGMSRGRNLRKLEPTEHNGYDNPYCRVWTSHHQYSKMTDRIRPFVNGLGFKSIGQTQEHFGDGLRPFKGNERLSDMSSLQDNGFPLIAPYDTYGYDELGGYKQMVKGNGEVDQKDLVKKCMFSIENLAWKDINVNALVDNTGNPVLTKEQQGPLGGRIMWFPPYNLKFTENVSARWEGNDFIGRGEQIYTYSNTERSGTLNFTVLVDHPSIVDKWAKVSEENKENEDKLLRFFAGCDELVVDNDTLIPVYRNSPETPDPNGPKPQRDVILNNPPVDPLKDNSRLPVDPVPETIQNFEKRFYVFFPNNLSGEDYLDNPRIIENYLFNGYNGTGGYEVSGGPLKGCLNTPEIVGKNMTWKYHVDNETVNQLLIAAPHNGEDLTEFGLNDNFRGIIMGDDEDKIAKLRSFFHLEGYPEEDILNFRTAESDLRSLITEEIREKYDINVLVNGYASFHGGQVSTAGGKFQYSKNGGKTWINDDKYYESYEEAQRAHTGAVIRKTRIKENDNYRLSTSRAHYVMSLFDSYNLVDSENIRFGENRIISVRNASVSDFYAKAGRSSEVIITFTLKGDVKPNDDIEYLNNAPVVHIHDEIEPAYCVAETSKKNKDDYQIKEIVQYEKVGSASIYDNEYLYFKKIGSNDSLIKKNIVEKVKYFDPAFHSITPEGFNARLTFLHQCTRQGPTYSVSDNEFTYTDGNGKKRGNFAGNLSFGRPPVCVLRIGDFYYTKIIIDSLSIDYDNNGGISWDMNPEGIGLQPMLANITIGFKFIGGSDLSGPIERLQNAVSSNFFANTSVYDRKSDYRKVPVTVDNKESQAWNASFILDNDNTTHTTFNPN